MKKEILHTTNYFNTFIEVAPDTPVQVGVVPVSKHAKKTLAQWQYDYLTQFPYRFTSDEILFQIFVNRHGLPLEEWELARLIFFSKGQPCFRSSPLPKLFGFGIHANLEGKVALFGMETTEYQMFVGDPTIKKIKAMRSSKIPRHPS